MNWCEHSWKGLSESCGKPAGCNITEETGITTEDAEAVHVAWFNGTSETVHRELQLAGVLELAAAKLRTGQGWDEGTTGDVLREILHVYPEQSRNLSGKLERG